jgi:HSP20 family protein
MVDSAKMIRYNKIITRTRRVLIIKNIKEMLIMTKLIPINHKNHLPLIGPSFGIWSNRVDRFLEQSFVSDRQLVNTTFKVDIEETEVAYLIEAELPGFQKDEVALTIDDHENLLISVKHQEKEANNGRHYICKERGIRATSRRIGLVGAKLDEITAKMENGVLFITVPKDEQASNYRKIAID